MKRTYTITGMTCGSCETKVKSALLSIDNVTSVEVSHESKTAVLEMENHIELSDIQLVLDKKYTVALKENKMRKHESKPWFSTYKPVILIFSYLLIVSMLLELRAEDPDIVRGLRHFMAGFFLTFSFFKMINLKEFNRSYAMYDILAKKFPLWGYIYAFTELGLGLAYLLDVHPVLTNAVTSVVMSISIVGVLQTVLDKRTIQCACLGNVFDLPMSTVTIIEDGLMILMSVCMLLLTLA